MKNEQIAAIFDQLADLLEITEANPFRVRAYRTASRTISSTAESFATMVKDGVDLTQFQGVGKDLARQIVEIVETKQHAQLVELQQQVPAGVVDMLRIPGVGPFLDRWFAAGDGHNGVDAWCRRRGGAVGR